ncbi:MAG: hypothetical protein LBQ14_10715 [Treponema sp.]|nr:hypothetical protein [Treponema sp.]
MKKRWVLTGTAGILLVSAVVFMGCNNGTTASPPQSREYIGASSDGAIYVVRITGNNYELVLFKTDGTVKTSTGAFTGGGDSALVLAPTVAPASTIEVTVNDQGINSITGSITFDDGSSESAPSGVTPQEGIFKDVQLYRITGWSQESGDEKSGGADGFTNYMGGGGVQALTFRIGNIEASGPSTQYKSLPGATGSISADGKLTMNLPAFIDDAYLFDMSNLLPGVRGGLFTSDPAVTPVRAGASPRTPSVFMYLNKAATYDGVNYVRGWNVGGGFPFNSSTYKIVYDLEGNIADLTP